MQTTQSKTSFGSHFSQVAWVVKDIHAAEKFFTDIAGVAGFVKMENLQAKELQGLHYGEPADYAFHLYLAYSGNSMIELIQPVSGKSIFRDYLDAHPNGGVQHIAYMVSEDELDEAIADLTGKGYQVITRLHLPVASVAFFDTTKEIGVVTEIIGLTTAGIEFLEKLKSGEILSP